MKDLLHRIIEEAVKLGADYVDARYEKTFSTTVRISNERIERVSTGVDEGIGVRILANGAFSFFSSNVLDLETIIRQVKESVRTAKALGDLKKEKIRLAEVRTVKDSVEIKARKSPQEIDLEEKVFFIKELNKISRGLDNRIVNSTSTIIDAYDKRILVTSEGTEIEYIVPRVYFGLDVVAHEAGRQAWYGKREAAQQGYEFLEKFEPEEVAKFVVNKVIKLLKAKPAPAGRFTVVMDNDLTGVFIHEAFGHACEGDGVAAGESILKDKLGEKVGSELVTVYDDSTLPGGWGSLKYDDEGVPTRKRTLVEKGVLVGFITDRESAAKLGLEPNGGARAESYDDPPIVRMSNTYIAPGDWRFEEMVEEIKYGIYLLGSRGGQVDTSKGTFQFNAKEAYLIENGEITSPLLDVSLSGYTLEVLANIDAVGRDFEIRPGFCGKGGQAVPAGTGGPHVRARNVVVGGRRR
ncbi:MAG: TldD/PmbA family protein [Thermoproteales archaeon]|nr:TldD/PmbA family protein [Thermoproteales archaeon]